LRLVAQLPTDRWRAEAWENAGGPPVAALTAELKAPADSSAQAQAALRAWAQSSSTSVAVAVGRLAAADAELAAQVARRLLLVAALPTDEDARVLLPVWAELDANDTEQGQGSLLAELLDPNHPPGQIRAGALAWLARQPDALTWTLDDAGLMVGTTNSPRSLFSLVPLAQREQSAIATLRSPASARLPQPTTLAMDPTSVRALAGQAIAVSLGRALAMGAGPSVPIEAVVPGLAIPPGEAVLGIVPLTPPGLPVGPPAPDWTLASIREAQTLSVPPPPAAALLLWDPLAQRPVLVFEHEPDRRTVIDAQRPDVLTVYVGPANAPTLIIEVTSLGQARALRGVLSAAPTFAPPATAGARWSVAIPLSPPATGGSLVQLGYTFAPAGGLRCAWPRPLLPWQTQPARLAIDAQAWDQGLTDRR
jgi:hypothetical protein